MLHRLDIGNVCVTDIKITIAARRGTVLGERHDIAENRVSGILSQQDALKWQPYLGGDMKPRAELAPY